MNKRYEKYIVSQEITEQVIGESQTFEGVYVR